MTPLEQHIHTLQACRRCATMQSSAVTGNPVYSPVMLVGQAPGDKEPLLGRPFAWTAGKTLFRWLQDACGLSEAAFRQRVYMAAVCRCFPGKKPSGGDRVPSPQEIAACAPWLQAEIALLAPQLVIPVGKLAIAQFLPYQSLEAHIGQSWRCHYAGQAFDLIPLPHPSGASPWPRQEPGKSLLRQALHCLAAHPALQELAATSRAPEPPPSADA
ncbi:MAG: uracil-DNA glycosylase family protein [Candidatus Tectimicrobiota bacterium]